MKIIITIDDSTDPETQIPVTTFKMEIDEDPAVVAAMKEPSPAMWMGGCIQTMFTTGELTMRTNTFIRSTEGIEGTEEAKAIEAKRVEELKAFWDEEERKAADFQAKLARLQQGTTEG